LANTIAVIDGGSVIAQGTAAELKRGVSGDHIELTFGDQRSFDAAMRLIIDGSHSDDETRSIRVPTSEPVTTIRELLAVTDRDGLDVANIAILRPTLDDVFLALTGHQATEQPEEDRIDSTAKGLAA
jgi:ABC-2 type transport system ATP-binding protein